MGAADWRLQASANPRMLARAVRTNFDRDIFVNYSD
jgi:hypothetical protein